MLATFGHLSQTELEAECRRVAPLIGIMISPDRFVDDFCFSGRAPWKGPRPAFGITEGSYRVLTHYLPDYLYVRLGIATFGEGERLRPLIEADHNAAGCWRVLLTDPNDVAALNGLRDRLTELGALE